MLLTSSVDSQARDARYNHLEFALPEITSLFILGDIDGAQEENYFIHIFFLNCLSIYILLSYQEQ